MKKMYLEPQELEFLKETKWNNVYENEKVFAIINKMSGVIKIKPKTGYGYARVYED